MILQRGKIELFLGPLFLTSALGVALVKAFPLSPFFLILVLVGFVLSLTMGWRGSAIGSGLLLFSALISGFPKGNALWGSAWTLSLMLGMVISALMIEHLDPFAPPEDVHEDQSDDVKRLENLLEMSQAKESKMEGLVKAAASQAKLLARQNEKLAAETLKQHQDLLAQRGPSFDQERMSELNTARVEKYQTQLLASDAMKKLKELQETASKSQLRQQFEEKKEVLHQVRTELFKTDGDLKTYQKLALEKEIETPALEKALTDYLKATDEECSRLEEENRLLNELVSTLVTQS